MPTTSYVTQEGEGLLCVSDLVYTQVLFVGLNLVFLNSDDEPAFKSRDSSNTANQWFLVPNSDYSVSLLTHDK